MRSDTGGNSSASRRLACARAYILIAIGQYATRRSRSPDRGVTLAAMPLEIDKDSLSRFDDRALHRQLADLIAAAISSGRLQPDETLPSEGELAAQAGLSKTAVRDALALLVQDGRIVK